MKDVLRLGFVSFGFLGCAPFAPGTFGTLGGVALAWLLGWSGHFLLLTVVVCALLYVGGRALGAWAEEYTGKKDPGVFVVDEVIGYLVAVAWIGAPTLATLTLGFFLFRFFDIVKPPPVRNVERVGGGDGILLDDVVAGLYALAILVPVRLFLLEPETWTVAP